MGDPLSYSQLAPDLWGGRSGNPRCAHGIAFATAILGRSKNVGAPEKLGRCAYVSGHRRRSGSGSRWRTGGGSESDTDGGIRDRRDEISYRLLQMLKI